MLIKFPPQHFRTKTEGGREFIFDSIRKTWVVLTEEEWVRQNFIQYMIVEMKYPSSLIAVEKELMLGELKKRFDILVYDPSHKPWMLVECKGKDIPLTPDVLDQVLRYNITIPVPFMVITNGHYTVGWEKREGGIVELESMPSFRF